MQRRDFFKKLGVVAAVATVVPTLSFAADAKKQQVLMNFHIKML